MTDTEKQRLVPLAKGFAHPNRLRWTRARPLRTASCAPNVANTESERAAGAAVRHARSLPERLKAVDQTRACITTP